MTGLRHVAVAGASAAGLAAADALRREGFDGRLTLIGAEDALPYDRPPLSKQILSGQWEPERVLLRSPEALEALQADFVLGTAATALDVGARKLTLSDGSVLGYDGLVIATGVRPRALPAGDELAGVCVLRTLDDALALRERLRAGPALVVVGAGFLGAEAAAVARGLGLDVTLVDPLATPMVRQLGPRVGAVVARLHEDHGVRLRLNTGVASLRGSGGRVTGVLLTDGSTVDADLVLVAVGSVPATEWLVTSGLALTDGVDCDAYCRAADGVVAAGDVASWPHPRLGRRIRVEHRTNAGEQGMAAAKTLLGKGEPFAPVPYFWSDQYDAKIHVHGTVPPDADLRIVDGDPGDGRFTALYGSGGRSTGALGWNMPKQGRLLRRHVVEGTAWATAGVTG
ncbi:NAD(P)/FAD-dependent oxidoreductase [Amycolatopsis samaneae]|uniref:NAD(P)/FAD-dependent oxidoreductase n=1 Tax=Amycolatopsis samaneae TaxID=664691 RepID=A0ABW5GUU2_9PSEU